MLSRKKKCDQKNINCRMSKPCHFWRKKDIIIDIVVKCFNKNDTCCTANRSHGMRRTSPSLSNLDSSDTSAINPWGGAQNYHRSKLSNPQNNPEKYREHFGGLGCRRDAEGDLRPWASLMPSLFFVPIPINYHIIYTHSYKLHKNCTRKQGRGTGRSDSTFTNLRQPTNINFQEQIPEMAAVLSGRHVGRRPSSAHERAET